MAKKLEGGTSVAGSPGRPSYKERVSKRMEIQQQLQALWDESRTASIDEENKRASAEQASAAVHWHKETVKSRNRMDGVGRHVGDDEYAMNAFQKEEFRKLDDAAKDAAKTAKSAKERKDSTAEEIGRLNWELKDLGYLLGADEVLSYQGDIAKAEKNVAEFQNLIAEQEGVIEKARLSAPDSLDPLLRKREDLLAAIVIGKSTDKDLQALDNEIKEWGNAIEEYNKIASSSRQIIAGLQRGLSSAENALNQLRSKRDDIMYEFLMGRAEGLGDEYIQLAQQLTEKFSQLCAIDSMLGPRYRVRGPDWDNIMIPLFNLEACHGMGLPHSQGELSIARQAVSLQGQQEALEAEKDRLTALGIHIN